MKDTTITVRGRVGADVRLARTPQDVPVATFRVGSTPRRRRDGAWQDGETLWVSVRAWRQLGTHVAASLSKGDPVLVSGRLVAEAWQREDGTRASRQVLVADAVGHDLTHGTARFERRPRAPEPAGGAVTKAGEAA